MAETLNHPDPRLSALQAKYGLSYHVPYAFTAEQMVGMRGKRVLEVGGSLPKEFVLEELGVAQWVAIEEMGYWDEQPVGGGGSTPQKRPERRLSSVLDYGDIGDYEVFGGGVEDLPAALCGQFDLVFSIAAFEHILLLPLALKKMHAALRSGGKLFSMFSPIWSAPDGHHLPTITDRSGKTMGFGNSPIPPWGHLLMRPPQLMQYLLRHTDEETAVRIVYYTYHSPHINRLFTEEYAAYIQTSPFAIEQLVGTFEVPVPPQVKSELMRLHPGRQHFGNNGMLMVLARAR